MLMAGDTPAARATQQRPDTAHTAPAGAVPAHPRSEVITNPRRPIRLSDPPRRIQTHAPRDRGATSLTGPSTAFFKVMVPHPPPRALGGAPALRVTQSCRVPQ